MALWPDFNIIKELFATKQSLSPIQPVVTVAPSLSVSDGVRVTGRKEQSTLDPPIATHDSCLPSVPVIDLQKLASVDYELERLHLACREWGFFQIINHGVSISLLEKFKLEIENFFKLPYEEKKQVVAGARQP
ncbi:hypothetical protein Patl1_29963 [Pistacia atlantica]|uniref:Uncharacterized protein n=1 Tax=Pistacia atlantica TaxID=434234 RepID=A0ACC1AE50_9ROSI|nr:hypothetical protein Patl1_29963 [Pistacia atlantica]